MSWIKKNKLFVLTMVFLAVVVVGVVLQIPFLLMLGVPMFAVICIGGLVEVIRWASGKKRKEANDARNP